MTEPLTHTLHLTLIGTAAIVTTSVATERQTCSAFPHRTLESPPASPSSFSSSSGTYVTKHWGQGVCLARDWSREATLVWKKPIRLEQLSGWVSQVWSKGQGKRSQEERRAQEWAQRQATEETVLAREPTGWPLASDLPILLPYAQNQGSSSVWIQSCHCSLNSVSNFLFIIQDKIKLHGLRCSCDQSLSRCFHPCTQYYSHSELLSINFWAFAQEVPSEKNNLLLHPALTTSLPTDIRISRLGLNGTFL